MIEVAKQKYDLPTEIKSSPKFNQTTYNLSYVPFHSGAPCGHLDQN